MRVFEAEGAQLFGLERVRHFIVRFDEVGYMQRGERAAICSGVTIQSILELHDGRDFVVDSPKREKVSAHVRVGRAELIRFGDA